MEKLKPCAHCGSQEVSLCTYLDAVIGSHGEMRRSYIHCYGCETEFVANQVMPFTTENMKLELAKRWNKRS